MTDQNTTPAISLLDAGDELARARGLVELIQMTCVRDPDAEQKAISEGCDVALERLDRVRGALEAHFRKPAVEAPQKPQAAPQSPPKVRSDKDLYADYLTLENHLGDHANLIHALQVVLWDFAQADISDRKLQNMRSAIIGLGDALEAASQKAFPEEFLREA
ncbi:hypothetical protein [Roseivivax marinus]|uniref:hypothetical protein n=1 Tax=Roseivivax marinus TaxID=1379903 RepID=UPI00273D4592|nr:hypothetical protein [Roseivivax marinus]